MWMSTNAANAVNINDKIQTGIPGFDEILMGGLEKGWAYLLRGKPGTGKTIFGLQYLMDGVTRGEKVAYISFDETKKEVELQAKSFGWDISNPDFYFVDKVHEIDILSSELSFLDYDSVKEIKNFIKSITELDALKDAKRVFIDGIGVLRDVVRHVSIYRRIVSSIVNFLNRNGSTTLISEELVDEYKGGGRSKSSCEWGVYF